MSGIGSVRHRKRQDKLTRQDDPHMAGAYISVGPAVAQSRMQ